MDRIATSQTYSSSLLALMNNQAKEQQAGQQVQTGYVADDLKGYAGSAQTLTAAQAVKSRIDSYLATNDSVSDRLAAQDTALNAVNDSATGARQALMNALATGDGTAMMQTLQGWFAQASDALNTDYQGSYLFSGGNSQTAPVDTETMTDLTTGGAASHFTNGTFKSTDRLDDSTTAQTGMTASDVAGSFFSVLQNIVAQNAATPFTGTLTTAQQAFLTSQLQPLADATTDISGQVAANGVNQDRVSALKTVLTDRQTAATTMISGVADADVAQSASNLTLAQTALQASAQVYQTLTTSSLLNLLQGTT